MSSHTFIPIAICLFAAPLLAQGYVDPGAGALIWQILAASFAGAMFLSRKFIVRWFKKKKTPPDL